MLCPKSLLARIKWLNDTLSDCHQHYRLSCIDSNILLEELVRVNKCQPGVMDPEKNMFIIGVIDKRTEDLVSYISFNVFPKTAIHIMYMCTNLDYRRKSLIQLVFTFLIELAYISDIHYITSFNLATSQRMMNKYDTITEDRKILELVEREPLSKMVDYFEASSYNMGGINSITKLSTKKTMEEHTRSLYDIMGCVVPKRDSSKKPIIEIVE